VTVEFYRSLWGPLPTGDDLSTLPHVCADTVARGYAGVEANPLMWGDAVDEARRIVADHGLGFLARAHTFGPDVASHVEFVRRCVEASLPFGTPHVIVQSGADSFDDAQIDDYFTATARIEAEFDVRLVHETHRGCILYSPWVAGRVLDRWPDLWLAADYSHWVLVCERVLERDELARFAPRVVHIDARVGSQARACARN
jgi:sugar phosphate isomerase/epimerase